MNDDPGKDARRKDTDKACDADAARALDRGRKITKRGCGPKKNEWDGRELGE